jgi:hypothetical protein
MYLAVAYFELNKAYIECLLCIWQKAIIYTNSLIHTAFADCLHPNTTTVIIFYDNHLFVLCR